MSVARRSLCLLLALVCSRCFAGLSGDESERWVFLGRFAADGPLSADVASHGATWRQLQGPIAVACETVAGPSVGGRPERYRWSTLGPGTPGPQGEKTLDDLEGFLEWALPFAHGKRCLLTLMGHATAPSWGLGGAGDWWRMWGRQGDPRAGLSSPELGEALRRSLRSVMRERVDVLVLEACSGASLEVLAELADCADVVVAVPGELPSPGIRWDVPGLGGRGDAREVAADLLAGNEQLSAAETGQTWSLTACRGSALCELAAALTNVCEAAKADLPALVRAARRGEARTALGERLHGVVDVGDLASGLRAYAAFDGLATAADALCAAARAAVLERVVIGGERSPGAEPMAQRVGLCLGLPPPGAGDIGSYLDYAPFARKTGWGSVLQRYLDETGALSPFRP